MTIPVELLAYRRQLLLLIGQTMEDPFIHDMSELELRRANLPSSVEECEAFLKRHHVDLPEKPRAKS